ncbi:TPA: hypothetical protein ACJIWV_002926 [Enterobacter asburiae]
MVAITWTSLILVSGSSPATLCYAPTCFCWLVDGYCWDETHGDNQMKQILFAWFVLTNTFACITASINVNNSLMLDSAVPWIVGISLAAITNYLLAKKLKKSGFL